MSSHCSTLRHFHTALSAVWKISTSSACACTSMALTSSHATHRLPITRDIGRGFTAASRRGCPARNLGYAGQGPVSAATTDPDRLSTDLGRTNAQCFEQGFGVVVAVHLPDDQPATEGGARCGPATPTHTPSRRPAHVDDHWFDCTQARGHMEIRALSTAAPFVTADGSTIRSLLDRTTAPVEFQSLAEATIRPWNVHDAPLPPRLGGDLLSSGGARPDGPRR